MIRIVAFPARAVDGGVQEQTGMLMLPASPAPRGGYPVVVYGHMTTGGSARSAPSTATPAHPEWRRMSQGDALCDRLVARGIAVLRPDYEGIGGPGVHPYLIGSSLAESVLAMMRERDSFDADLGDMWVAAGHSEGAVAALHASAREEPDAQARLVGTAVFGPVTRMDVSIGAARRIAVPFPGSGVVSALIALMLRGAAATDAGMRRLLETDGLSERAAERWADLDELCLTELAADGSWGGIAPGRIGGRAGDELFAMLAASFRANEVAALRGFRAPLRIDAARFDEVAPAPLTARMLRGYRSAGVPLDSAWWPTHHSGMMRPQHAPSRAAEWIAARFAG
ncbi:alpha/beta hydrolase family protein [Microbacterium sp. ASV49]|uniref:Lipase family protein n=1 Tax=Microbacterium candidum TaxID=3041922 RepID=A0ABT7MYI8_9MICO|nr:lipase family protein [Microbacterium sp. ASV49]MDL9979523.1 lipase family protein [Microbacterium sp. ASV49]